MKPKPEFETPFEESLAEFEMAPLPLDWKSEMIDNAISASAGSRASRLFTFRRITFGVLAACWLATAILHFTTPTDPGFSEESVSLYAEIDSEDVSILVSYFGQQQPQSPDYRFQ